MSMITKLLVLLAVAVSASGCGNMTSTTDAIMQATPGDPVGSANIGTGSVTVGGVMPEEAKAAGIGIGP